MDLQTGLWMLVTSSMCADRSNKAQVSRTGSLRRLLRAATHRLALRLSRSRHVEMVRRSWS